MRIGTVTWCISLAASDSTVRKQDRKTTAFRDRGKGSGGSSIAVLDRLEADSDKQMAAKSGLFLAGLASLDASLALFSAFNCFSF